MDKEIFFSGVHIEEGSIISSQTWNDRDDIRRHQFEAFLRYLVGYGVDTDQEITLEIKENKVYFTCREGVVKFRLFLNGTYVSLEADKDGKACDFPVIYMEEAGKLYLFAYEYQLPVQEPWRSPHGIEDGIWTGCVYWKDYANWLGLPLMGDISHPDLRIPSNAFANRLLRDFAFVVSSKEFHEIENELPSRLNTLWKERGIKKDAQFTISQCHAQLLLPGLSMKLCPVSQCHTELPSVLPLPGVCFSSAKKKDMVPLQTYPEEIGVRMTQGLLVNPVDWNLTDKFRRVEQEKFLYWLVEGKEGIFVQTPYLPVEWKEGIFVQPPGYYCLYVTKMRPDASIQYQDDDQEQRMMLVLSTRPGENQTIFCTTRKIPWEKNGIKSSDRLVVEAVCKQGASATQIEIPYSTNPTSTSSKTTSKIQYDEEMRPFLEPEVNSNLEYSHEAFPQKKIEFNQKIVVTPIANEILAGVPITHLDFNNMDDIRRFALLHLVACLFKNGAAYLGEDGVPLSPSVGFANKDNTMLYFTRENTASDILFISQGHMVFVPVEKTQLQTTETLTLSFPTQLSYLDVENAEIFPISDGDHTVEISLEMSMSWLDLDKQTSSLDKQTSSKSQSLSATWGKKPAKYPSISEDKVSFPLVSVTVKVLQDGLGTSWKIKSITPIKKYGFSFSTQ